MDRRPVQALIHWDIDPSRLPLNEWIRDLIVNFGQIKDKTLYGDSWTVLVRITKPMEGTRDTYADVAFIVDEAPWHLLEPGFCFKLWAGKEVATVVIL